VGGGGAPKIIRQGRTMTRMEYKPVFIDTRYLLLHIVGTLSVCLKLLFELWITCLIIYLPHIVSGQTCFNVLRAQFYMPVHTVAQV
jgi:hypothetical protein